MNQSKSNNLAKRKSRLEHAMHDQQALKKLADSRSEDVSRKLLNEMASVSQKIELAWKKIDSLDAELYVNRATSAQATMSLRFTEIGIKVSSGGRKGRNLVNDPRTIEDRLTALKDWMRRNPDRSRGWKTRAANALVAAFDIEFEAARKFVRRHARES